MPINITHAESSWLIGFTRFQRAIKTFNIQWHAPLGETLVKMAVKLTPPEVRDRLPAPDKEFFDMLAGDDYGKSEST